MVLVNKLPNFYKQSDSIVNIQGTLEKERSILEENIKRLINDLFVITSENIERWEKLVGIKTDSYKDIDVRRNTIKSKMAGTGTFTKDMLINTLKVFEGGNAEIIEQFADYIFLIKFNDEYRVPSGEALNEIYDVVNVLKPAHLNFNHTFTYNWWGRKELKAKTWGDFSTWNDLRKYKEEL